MSEQENQQEDLNDDDQELDQNDVTVDSSEPDEDTDAAEEIKKIYLEKKSNEEALLGYIEGLLKKKRKGYGEAKKHRMEKEQLLEEYEKLKSQLEGAETEKVKALQAELNALKDEKENYARLANERAAEKSKLSFDYAVEKHKAKDAEYMEFLLKKHVEDLSKDEDALKSFKVDEWMSEVKKSKPDLFSDKESSTSQRSYATSGINTQSATTQTNDSAISPVSRSRKERAEAENEWLQYKKLMGIK